MGQRSKTFAIVLLRSLACREEAGSVFHPVSEHILRTKIKTPFGHTSIIAVYAPTKPTTANEVTVLDESYQQLHATLAVIPTRDMVNIMGYFHARVGSDNGMWKKLLVVTVQISEMRMMKEQDVEKVCVCVGGGGGGGFSSLF